MSRKVQDILSRLSGKEHRGGAFSSEVLAAISETLPDFPTVSLETGCGKSTVMFSNLSSKHYVFAYDDRGQPGSSVEMVQSDPEFKSENTVFVFGPTQRTIPTYEFPHGLTFDVILIDGPHGYPFPDLEYALLYDRLRPGGTLILDDVHIASIGKMYDLLREDRMYEEIGVFATTGLLRRSAIDGVPSDGDHWFEQNYNVSRFPLPMEKYHLDRSVEFGKVISLRDRALLQKYSLKALVPTDGDEGGQTIDLVAELQFDLTSHTGPAVVEIAYRSNYLGASQGASISFSGQSYDLPFHQIMATERFAFDVSPGQGLRVRIFHPNAAPEHDRGNQRYDFRRFGAVIGSLKFANVSRKGAAESTSRVAGGSDTVMKSELVSRDEGKIETPLDATNFGRVLSEFSSIFPYGEELSNVGGSAGATPVLIAQGPLYRFLGSKIDWHFGEFLPFEGEDYVEATTRALLGRPATQQERNRISVNSSATEKVVFALELDSLNRKGGSPVRIRGLKLCRRLWRTALFFDRKGLKLPSRLTQSVLRRVTRNIASRLMLQASERHLILMMLDGISSLQGREGNQ